MKTDDLKRIILKMFKGSELYGYEIHKRLESQGVEAEMGRLYRVLNDMLKDKRARSGGTQDKTTAPEKTRNIPHSQVFSTFLPFINP